MATFVRWSRLKTLREATQPRRNRGGEPLKPLSRLRMPFPPTLEQLFPTKRAPGAACCFPARRRRRGGRRSRGKRIVSAAMATPRSNIPKCPRRRKTGGKKKARETVRILAGCSPPGRGCSRDTTEGNNCLTTAPAGCNSCPGPWWWVDPGQEVPPGPQRIKGTGATPHTCNPSCLEGTLACTFSPSITHLHGTARWGPERNASVRVRYLQELNTSLSILAS